MEQFPGTFSGSPGYQKLPIEKVATLSLGRARYLMSDESVVEPESRPI